MKIFTQHKGWVSYLVILSILVNACKPSEKHNDYIRINIYTPGSCEYTFTLYKDSMVMTNKNEYYNTEAGNFSNDSTRLKYTYTEYERQMAINYIDSIKFQPFDKGSMEQNDAHHYEVYYNNELLGCGHCCNDYIHTIFRDCILPHMEERKIACSGFFGMMQQIANGE